MLCKICLGAGNTQHIPNLINPSNKIVRCGFCGGRGVLHPFIQPAVIICKGFNDSHYGFSGASIEKNNQIFSISVMTLENKPLMAHLMVDLKLFDSVGQAKKNGWNKPLELGLHELGPKKKRITVEVIA